MKVSGLQQFKDFASDVIDKRLVAGSLVVNAAAVALKVFGTPAVVQGVIGAVGAAVLHGALLPIAIAVDVLVIGYFAYRAYEKYQISRLDQGELGSIEDIEEDAMVEDFFINRK